MTDRIISDREAELLRERIAFITRDGGYRTVITDSESADGIMPRCTSPDHPEDDREQQWTLYDCCDTGDGYRLIETGHEHIASVWVDSLYVIPALLDERDALRARVAELEAAPPAAEQDGNVRAVAAPAMGGKYLNRLAGLADLPCSCGVADCEIYMSALTRDQAQELVAEARRARAALAARGADGSAS